MPGIVTGQINKVHESELWITGGSQVLSLISVGYLVVFIIVQTLVGIQIMI